MGKWTVDDIDWAAFDRSKVTPELISVVKAASLVEHNGKDYARYLYEVFPDDPEFKQAAETWALEEVQHGVALRKWAEMADPSFDFEKSFQMFTDGYKLPMNVETSVRGSRSGELVARCIVEIGTSSYYTAIGNFTDEPVLKAVCHEIAADEIRHYKLFHTHLERYLAKENIGFWQKLRIALGRIAESEDDELAYAFYASHYNGNDYDHELYKNRYMAHALAFYRKEHVRRMTRMLFKAVGVKPFKIVEKAATQVAWGVMQYKSNKLAEYRVAA